MGIGGLGAGVAAAVNGVAAGAIEGAGVIVGVGDIVVGNSDVFNWAHVFCVLGSLSFGQKEIILESYVGEIVLPVCGTDQ
jgi:hypothetical protein